MVVRFLFIVGVVLGLVGCSSAQVEEMTIYKLKSFAEVDEHSMVTITDQQILKDFSDGINGAKRQAGIVNIVDPHYKIVLGNQSYFLWTDIIMNTEDTHTIYTLSKASSAKINKAIKLTMPHTLSEWYHGHLSKVDKLEIKNGVGELRSTQDKGKIDQWLTEIKEISLIPDTNQEGGVGWNYWVKLYVGDKQVIEFFPNKINEVYILGDVKVVKSMEELFYSLK